MPARMKANGNFSDASLERFYLVSINRVMSLSNVCDVTVAYSNHKNFLYFVHVHLCPPTLKKVPPPMTAG